jgi:glycosyltransferase involved in cell wall biosynthesis
MKILHVISSSGMYGAEAVILNLLRAFNEGPHLSFLGVFSNFPEPNLQLHEAAIGQGVESHMIPCNGRFDRGPLARIRELVTGAAVDVVHAHGYKADIFVYLALRALRVPLVSTCHTWYDNDRKVYLYGALDRRILRNYARVTAVSEQVRLRLLKAGVAAEKINIIRNGIDLRPFDHARADLKDELGWNSDPIIGVVGRLSIEKGIDIFLHAAARVLVDVPCAKFVVAGDGPDRAQLETLIETLGIRKSVRILGRRDDMPCVYASLDVMVSSSRQEGLPIAILEGMASRRALIATSVGAVPEVVRDGSTGVLVATEDVSLLALRIVELLGDPGRRERLGFAARKLVESEFSAERMMVEYLRTYEAAIASVAHGGRAGRAVLPVPGGTST